MAGARGILSSAVGGPCRFSITPTPWPSPPRQERVLTSGLRYGGEGTPLHAPGTQGGGRFTPLPGLPSSALSGRGPQPGAALQASVSSEPRCGTPLARPESSGTLDSGIPGKRRVNRFRDDTMDTVHQIVKLVALDVSSLDSLMQIDRDLGRIKHP
jgi:hypothetical protein